MRTPEEILKKDFNIDVNTYYHTYGYLYQSVINAMKIHEDEVVKNISFNLMLPAVAWEAIADDDFVFRFGDYCLRVEQMNKRYWWWCIYYKDDYAGFDEPKAKTELEAKLLAEICFVRHWLSHNR